MRTPLAQSKTLDTLAAARDSLRRELNELQKLREAVAEAERENGIEIRAEGVDRVEPVLRRREGEGFLRRVPAAVAALAAAQPAGAAGRAAAADDGDRRERRRRGAIGRAGRWRNVGLAAIRQASQRRACARQI